MAIEKHYVIALGSAYLPDTPNIVKGTIISRHTVSYKASDAATKYNDRNRTTSRKPLFGVLSCDLSLEKGDVRDDLADQWLADKFDRDALHAMKCVLDPSWRGGRPIDDEQIGWLLEDLALSLDELRESYETRARASLDEASAERIAQGERRARMEAVSEKLTGERSQFTYTFPAVAGTQAERAYYVAQVPLGALVRLFRFDEEDTVPAHLRAQRVLNERRAEAIGDYLVNNRSDYVLPAITASVSAEMAFEPVHVTGASGSIGLLHIPMEATLLINDGQHRRSGIELAIKKAPALAKETVAVTIYYDQGLERSQQMFADINAKQVKPSSAINALYDRRNPFNTWVLQVIAKLPGIAARIDMENSSVAAKSYKLWSLVAFKKALSLLTGLTEKSIVQVEDAKLAEITEFVLKFFAECSERIPDWRQMVTGQIAAIEVREHFVIGHAVWLEGLAVFARHALFTGHQVEHGRLDEGVIRPDHALWERLEALSKVDTRKSALMWDRRCVVLGKMQKTSDGVNGTAAQLLKLANAELPATMRDLERRLAA